MKKSPVSTSTKRSIIAIAGLFVLTTLPPAVFAQDGDEGVNKTDTSIDVQNYRPNAGPGNYFGVSGTDITPNLQVGFSLDVNYQHRPLVLEIGEDGKRSNAVAYQVTLDFLWSLGLFDILQIGVVMPVVVAQDGKGLGEFTGEESLSTTAIRDLRLQLKGRVIGGGRGKLEAGGFGLAISLGMSVPTGDDENFAGDKNVTADAPVLIFDWRNNLVRVAVNVGLRWREKSSLGYNFSLGHQFLYGAAIAVTPLGKRLLALVEYEGMCGFEKLDDTMSRLPMEARAGVGVAIDKNKDLSVVIGGGMGFGDAPTVPVFRVVGSIRYAPQNRDSDSDGILDRDDKCPDEKEDYDEFEDDDGCPDLDNDGDGLDDPIDDCPMKAEDMDNYQDEDGCPDNDNDGDGIEDADDKCPDDPEDRDNFKDDDGCPDLDNDEDGVSDDKDRCVDKPEDRDGFEDDDGCPDMDNDSDGIEDSKDKCPDRPEDKDGFEDEDGCPDNDNDGDGVPDSIDRCPDEPETFNGKKDKDGCPDGGRSLVEMKKGEIKVNQKIQFKKDSAEMKGKSSFLILNVVAEIMKMNPGIKVEVQGHTDNTGLREHNLELSQKRAEAVMNYLVKKGVSADRLTAKGYGPDKPIADNSTAKGRKANRRIEFKIK